jgi:hypothetical protein
LSGPDAEQAIVADSIDLELHPAMASYRDNGVILDTAGHALYWDAEALTQLQARATHRGRQVSVGVLVIAALVVAARAILFGLHGWRGSILYRQLRR